MKKKKIKFRFYISDNFFTKMIGWRIYSQFYHVAIEVDDLLIESRISNGHHGVICTPVSSVSDRGKYITIEVWMTNWQSWFLFLKEQIGKKYDKKAIFSFLRNKEKQKNSRWFCSELANTFFEYELTNYKTERLVSPQSFYDMLKIYSLIIKK